MRMLNLIDANPYMTYKELTNSQKEQTQAVLSQRYGGKVEAAFFTQPDLAKDFVNRTGVDALAISVGNAHGAYKLPPKLDFARIETIAGLIPDTALVLHGGSGLSDEDFRTAIKKGIAKVNIFTDINVAQVRAVMENCHDVGKGITDVIACQVEAVKAETLKKMELFGSVGKA